MGQSPKPIYIVNRETGKDTEFQPKPESPLLYMGFLKDITEINLRGIGIHNIFALGEKEGLIGKPFDDTHLCENYYWDGAPSPAKYKEAYVKHWKEILHRKGIMKRNSNYSMDEEQAGRNYK